MGNAVQRDDFNTKSKPKTKRQPIKPFFYTSNSFLSEQIVAL